MGLLFLALGTGCGDLFRVAQWKRHQEAGQNALEQGNYAEAEKRFRAALEEAREIEPKGPVGPAVGARQIQAPAALREERFRRGMLEAESLHSLSTVYKLQGKYDQAKAAARRSFKILRKFFGPHEPEIAASLGNLASVYQAEGQYAKAEQLYEQALAIMETELGPEDPQVATALERYATLLRETGRDAEANELDARAERIRATLAEENVANRGGSP